MELYNEMLMKLLDHKKIEVSIPALEVDPYQFVDMKSYQTLKRIHEILKCEAYSDEDCVDLIEEIICEFEQLGTHCGLRHD